MDYNDDNLFPLAVKKYLKLKGIENIEVRNKEEDFLLLLNPEEEEVCLFINANKFSKNDSTNHWQGLQFICKEIRIKKQSLIPVIVYSLISKESKLFKGCEYKDIFNAPKGHYYLELPCELSQIIEKINNAEPIYNKAMLSEFIKTYCNIEGLLRKAIHDGNIDDLENLKEFVDPSVIEDIKKCLKNSNKREAYKLVEDYFKKAKKKEENYYV